MNKSVGRNLKVHLPFMLVYVATFVYEIVENSLAKLVPKSQGTIYESRLRFLTYWDFVLQTVFFTVCVIADIIAKDENHILRRIQNRIMVALAYPLAMFVGVTFWSIYLVDRELILPKAMDVFFPVWLNHCMHTNIVIFMLIEFITTRYTYAPRALNLKILLTVMIAYLVWLFVIYVATDVWVYPILHVLPWPLKIVFFLGCLALVIVLYLSGEKLNAFIHQDKSQVVNVRATSMDSENTGDATAASKAPTSVRVEKKEKKKKRSL